MPQKVIPCEDCKNEKEKIEESGDAEVISCDPIPDKPGFCLIIWQNR